MLEETSGRRSLYAVCMPSKTKPTPRKEPVPQEEDAASLTDHPLLDLSDAAIKELIHIAKQHGHVTHDQISALSKDVNSEQVEDVLAMFSAMGVSVVQTEGASEHEGQREEAGEEAEPESSELEHVPPQLNRGDSREAKDRRVYRH